MTSYSSKTWMRLHDDPMQEKILWSCIARNGTILVEAGEDPFDGAVSRAARGIFSKKTTPGWEYYTLKQPPKKKSILNGGSLSSLYPGRNYSSIDEDNVEDGSTTTEEEDDEEEDDDDEEGDTEDDDESQVSTEDGSASDSSSRRRRRRNHLFRRPSTPKLKAVKFHVYENPKGDWDHLEEPIIWVFAAVYNPKATTWTPTVNNPRKSEVLRDVKSFIQKIVGLTDMPRTFDDNWRNGPQLACQSSFAATLLQRMQEVTYFGEIARVVVDDDSLAQRADAEALMQANITAIFDREQHFRDMRDKSNKLLETASKLQHKTQRVLRRRILMQKAKHGVQQGALATAATALVIIPPILAIL